MFQFTTTNVINSAYESGYAGEESHVIWSTGKDERGNSVLVLKRIGTFKANEVSEIDRAMPVAPIKAKAVVNLVPSGAEVGDTLRLNLYVGLSQGSNDAMYANDYWFKGKPLVIEYIVENGTTADTFVKNVKKFLLNVCEEKWMDFEAKGDDLTITMVNEYQRFRNLSIEKLNRRAYHGMGDWETLSSLKEMVQIKETDVDKVKEEFEQADSEIGTYFAGQEGFGTSDFILHNLRIPTSANSRWLSVHEDERPVEGANYVQYTIHQCADRGPLGLNAVGLHVTSTTTHVLYVKEDLIDEFELVLMEFIQSVDPHIKNFDVTYTPWNTEAKKNFA